MERNYLKQNNKINTIQSGVLAAMNTYRRFSILVLSLEIMVGLFYCDS